jgi:molybdopterin molybdotransferase
LRVTASGFSAAHPRRGGLNICEDIVATINLPRFDNSAMDGYAVRAEDVADASQDAPLSLPVVGEIAAGKAAVHRLSPGTAMKIMTGAPVPLERGRDSSI